MRPAHPGERRNPAGVRRRARASGMLTRTRSRDTAAAGAAGRGPGGGGRHAQRGRAMSAVGEQTGEKAGGKDSGKAAARRARGPRGHGPRKRSDEPSKFRQWLLHHRVESVAGPRGQARAPRGAPVVEGHVPDRCRLLLHAELPARHRAARRGRGLAAGHAADRAAHPVRDAADVPPGGGGEPLRAGVGGDAGAAAAVLEGQVLRADAARLRLHVVDHHDHAVRGRRHRALRARTRSPRR